MGMMGKYDVDSFPQGLNMLDYGLARTSFSALLTGLRTPCQCGIIPLFQPPLPSPQSLYTTPATPRSAGSPLTVTVRGWDFQHVLRDRWSKVGLLLVNPINFILS